MSAHEILAKHVGRVETEREARIRAAQDILAANPDLQARAREWKEHFPEARMIRVSREITAVTPSVALLYENPHTKEQAWTQVWPELTHQHSTALRGSAGTISK